jgi:hypothetical protein
MSSELLPIKLIKQSSSLQPRATMDTEIIDQYTEAMRTGSAFPAVIVYRIGGDLFLVDGYHRFMAAQGAKLDKILAEVRAGTMRDAILFSAGVNATHGLNRTNEDKRRAASVLLRDKEWGQWADTKIAAVCHVSVDLVATVRKSILGETDRCTSDERKVERAGKVFKMKTGKIGKKEKPAFAMCYQPGEIKVTDDPPIQPLKIEPDSIPDLPPPLPPDAPIAEKLKRDNLLLQMNGFSPASRLDAAKPIERPAYKIVPVQLTAAQAEEAITSVVRGYLTKAQQGIWEDIRKSGECGDTNLDVFQGMIDRMGAA